MTDAQLRQAVDDAQAAFDDVLPRHEPAQPLWWIVVVGLELVLGAAVAGLVPWWAPLLAFGLFYVGALPEVRRDRRAAEAFGLDARNVRRRPTGEQRSGCLWGLFSMTVVIGFAVWGGTWWYVGVVLSAAASLAARCLRSGRTPWIPRWPGRDRHAQRRDAFASLGALRVFAVMAVVESVSASLLAERLKLNPGEVDAVIAELSAAACVSEIRGEGETRYKANWGSRREFRTHLRAIAPRTFAAPAQL